MLAPMVESFFGARTMVLGFLSLKSLKTHPSPLRVQFEKLSNPEIIFGLIISLLSLALTHQLMTRKEKQTEARIKKKIADSS
jgi:hypothetical protein